MEMECVVILLVILIIVIWYSNIESLVGGPRRVTLHYTNWCSHCKIMKPVWNDVKALSAGSGIVFAEIDEDVNKTPGVTGYPTIRMIDEKGGMHTYGGSPDADSLYAWVKARY